MDFQKEIEEEKQRRLDEKEKFKKELYLKSGLLCLHLTKDYRREEYWKLGRLEQSGESFDTKYKRRELENNLDLGAFILDADNRKYFKIYQITEDDDPQIHAFVDFTDGMVYKPRSESSANRKLGWDIDLCLKVADWHGYYLNKDPE
tara:strand:+ start:664 stop:1104 length:441 start_codon:yes stop_codon:yes gene_type:complete